MDNKIKIDFVSGGINSIVGSIHNVVVGNKIYNFQELYEGCELVNVIHISSLSNFWKNA